MEIEDTPGGPSTVVGIGASAGGLGALRTLLSQLPERTGLAFVVVVHLAPDQQSHLASLLQPHCSMPVRQVTRTVTLKADHVYVIPPGSNLSAVDTHLRLTDLESQRRNRSPIDHFFETLAATHAGHAIGVVLTGTGSDGTLGLAAIRAHGGLAIVQEPNEAEFDGMPRSGLAAGATDLTLTLAEIAEHVVKIANTNPGLSMMLREDDTATAATRQILQQIFGQIRARTGHDVSGYKEATTLRRIRRRMQLHQIDDVEVYFEKLRTDRSEVVQLFDDLLISVTRFFRDGEVFAELERSIIHRLFEGKGPQDQVRVWSVGCSSGEEAYSLAILLLEHAATLDHPPQIQLFASDLHEQSLQRARDGIYSVSIDADVSAERLRRFFVAENGSYRVRKELREIVVFAPHGLLKDPPFSHIDLISCRNLLIYLQRSTQNDAISLFHYALAPGGYLVLGTSEAIDRSDLFATVDKRRCIFQRHDGTPRDPKLPMTVAAGPVTMAGSVAARSPRSEPAFGSLHARLVEQYAPPSILIDGDDRIVHYSEHAGRFLTHPGGEPTTDLHRIVRPELRLDLRTTVHAARNEGRSARGRPATVTVNGDEIVIVVRAVPTAQDNGGDFLLIIFDEADTGVTSLDATECDRQRDDRDEQLESELDLTRQRLQQIVEECESSQEEMRASNEELQSTNEELRSTMEELETSKEELQSMNEELTTLNQENRHKVDELGRLSDDLQNLLTATDIATMFLDRQLRIVRFTPPITRIVNIVNADRGRPFTDLTHQLTFDGLADEARRVLDDLIPLEHEIQSLDGRWLLTNLRPYRTADNHIEGVVITFVDITRRFEAENSLRSSARRLRLALDASSMGSWSWYAADGKGEADERSFAVIGFDQPGPDFMSALESCLDAANTARLHEALDSQERGVIELRATRHRDRTPITLSLQFRHDEEPESVRGQASFIGTIDDVTERVELSQRLEAMVFERTEDLRASERQIRDLIANLTRAEQLERERIGQVLHDDLQQLLYGAQMRLGLLREDVEVGERTVAYRHLDDADRYITDGIALTRQITVDLAPQTIDDDDVTETLNWLAEQMHEMHGLDVQVDVTTDVTVDDRDLRILLYRTIRELLFNVVKHSDVGEADVTVEVDAGRLKVTVSDEGRGFDPVDRLHDHQSSGRGLANIQQRLELIGGGLSVDSVPGDGTRIVVTCPTGYSALAGNRLAGNRLAGNLLAGELLAGELRDSGEH